MDILWLTLNWPVWIFVLAVAACIVVLLKYSLTGGMLALSWVVYTGTVWNPWWEWIPSLFWLAFLAGLAGFIWGLLNGGGRTLAVWGAGAALVIGLCLANSNIFSASPPLDRKNPGITGNFEQLKEKDKDLQKQQDGSQERLTWLDGRITELEQRISKLEKHRSGK